MTTPPRKRIDPLRAEQLPDTVWRRATTVRFRDCDPAGIVFTPRYFDILNEAVEAFFCDRLGIDYYDLIGTRRIGLGYGTATCEFLRPNRMGDVLEPAVVVERVGRASYALVVPIMKAGREVARGRLVTVTTSLDTHTACPIPDDVRAALLAYHETCATILERIAASEA